MTRTTRLRKGPNAEVNMRRLTNGHVLFMTTRRIRMLSQISRSQRNFSMSPDNGKSAKRKITQRLISDCIWQLTAGILIVHRQACIPITSKMHPGITATGASNSKGCYLWETEKTILMNLQTMNRNLQHSIPQ